MIQLWLVIRDKVPFMVRLRVGSAVEAVATYHVSTYIACVHMRARIFDFGAS